MNGQDYCKYLSEGMSKKDEFLNEKQRHKVYVDYNYEEIGVGHSY